jgi:hypothetical protein
MEFSIFEALIILAILLLNFAIVAYFKNKIAVVSSVMVGNLIIILLYSATISDHQILQELILAIILYSVTILVLIYNTSHIDQINSRNTKFKKINKANVGFVFIITTVLSFGGFYLISNIKDQSNKTNKIVNYQGRKILKMPDTQIELKQNNAKSILFKKSTDAILIIVWVMTILLLSSKYRDYESDI